jgi:hypothetical protein
MSDHATVARLLELQREIEAVCATIADDPNYAEFTKKLLRDGATAMLDVYIEARNNLPDSKFRKCYRCEDGTIERVFLRDAMVSRMINGQWHNIHVPQHSVLRCNACGNECVDGVSEEPIERAMDEYMAKLLPPPAEDPEIVVPLEYDQAILLWEALTYLLGDRREPGSSACEGVVQSFKERLYDAIDLAERGAKVP